MAALTSDAPELIADGPVKGIPLPEIDATERADGTAARPSPERADVGVKLSANGGAGHELGNGRARGASGSATTSADAEAMGYDSPVAGNGHHLVVSSDEKAVPVMSDELKDIFNKLIDEQGQLDMRNVTTLIWVNRKRHYIVETIVELLIENSNERRAFNGIEFYLPQLAHMIIHLDVHLPSSALEQFALVVCQQSLHVALQLNWILVAALEDYHPELPDGSPNHKANAVYFNRCAKLLQNVERIIALGAPSATELEELYKTGQLSRHEVESRTIAERKKQAEKVISSPKRGLVPVAEGSRVKGWLWHKRWHKRGFPHRSRWIRRWFEVEDRVLYCYSPQLDGEDELKRAAVLYQATVKNCDYKDGKYPYYFEVHSPMGNMRLRAEDQAGKEAWINSLQKLAQAMPSVAHLYANDGVSSGGVTANAKRDSEPASSSSSASKGNHDRDLARPSSITEGNEEEDSDGERKSGDDAVREAIADGGINAFKAAATQLLAGTAAAREKVMSMSTVVLEEAKRTKRFRFFREERQFVSDLTDICETLRFEEDRSKRGALLESLLTKVHIPECAYLPLCRSTEAFQRVLRITPNEAKAFSTKERVPVMVTFETERTWTPETRSAGAAPLDVASFLHYALGFHASQQHQDQQRYSSSALRGGQDSILEPDVLAVGDGEGGQTSTPGPRHSRNGSFRFRAGSKSSLFPHMPPVHLPGTLSSVWRDKPAGAEAAKARGTKSPFRHNLSSFGSALQARASSIRHNVKLGRPSISKRGPGNTPGSQLSVSSVGEEREGSVADAGPHAAVPLPEAEGGKAKNVAWDDLGKDDQEKQEKTYPIAGQSGIQVTAAYGGEAKEEDGQGDVDTERDDRELPESGAKNGADSSEAVAVKGTSLDKALEEKYVPSALENISLTDDPGRSGINDGEPEVEELRTPCRAYGESMESKARRIRRQSQEGSREGWALQRLILKSNDDVRQEVFVMQMIIFYQEVFDREGLDLWLKPYSIVSTAKTTGLIELCSVVPIFCHSYGALHEKVLNQSTSLDGLKKSAGYPGSLFEHFKAVFGDVDSEDFKAAQRRFACSLAGYSVVSYLLGIKDRHNGNVMLDSDGHIVHIDFGFVFGIAPGKQFSMERAAFKFTPEYVELLGGKGSELYEAFVDMFTKGLSAARKYATITITMMEIMMFQSEFPCFEYMGDAALTGFKKRLMLGAKDSDVARRARRMVEHANGHWALGQSMNEELVRALFALSKRPPSEEASHCDDSELETSSVVYIPSGCLTLLLFSRIQVESYRVDENRDLSDKHDFIAASSVQGRSPFKCRMSPMQQQS